MTHPVSYDKVAVGHHNNLATLNCRAWAARKGNFVGDAKIRLKCKKANQRSCRVLRLLKFSHGKCKKNGSIKHFLGNSIIRHFFDVFLFHMHTCGFLEALNSFFCCCLSSFKKAKVYCTSFVCVWFRLSNSGFRYFVNFTNIFRADFCQFSVNDK